VLDDLRDWLTLAAAIASAVFAGLVWWRARARVRVELVIETVKQDGIAICKLHITNPTGTEYVVDHLSVEDPTRVVIDAKNGQLSMAEEFPAGVAE
jgi:hypothetical protein